MWTIEYRKGSGFPIRATRRPLHGCLSPTLRCIGEQPQAQTSLKGAFGLAGQCGWTYYLRLGRYWLERWVTPTKPHFSIIRAKAGINARPRQLTKEEMMANLKVWMNFPCQSGLSLCIREDIIEPSIAELRMGAKLLDLQIKAREHNLHKLQAASLDYQLTEWSKRDIYDMISETSPAR